MKVHCLMKTKNQNLSICFNNTHSSTRPMKYLSTRRQSRASHTKQLTCDCHNIDNGKDQAKSVESHGQIGKG